jgi:hypothetical protein
MKYAIENGSFAMTYSYIPNFIKTGSGIHKLKRGDTETAWWSHKLNFILSK